MIKKIRRWILKLFNFKEITIREGMPDFNMLNNENPSKIKCRTKIVKRKKND